MDFAASLGIILTYFKLFYSAKHGINYAQRVTGDFNLI